MCVVVYRRRSAAALRIVCNASCEPVQLVQIGVAGSRCRRAVHARALVADAGWRLATDSLSRFQMRCAIMAPQLPALLFMAKKLADHVLGDTLSLPVAARLQRVVPAAPGKHSRRQTLRSMTHTVPRVQQ